MNPGKETNITVYGTHWCPDCRRSKQFLGEHKIPYHWVDIEQDKAGEQYVMEKNTGKRIIPTIEFSDGSILVEPSNADLAARMGLKTKAERTHYDLVVVGGGPAGLTAALYTAREGIDTLVIERAAVGGQAASTERLDNMPGFPDGVEGAELASRLRQQVERFGVELLQAQDVNCVYDFDNYKGVDTADGSRYTSQAVLLATGSRYKHLGVPGEGSFIGAGVHFCATCDGPFYKGKRVAVVGGGNSAAEESLFLVKFVEHITLLVRGEKLAASQVIVEKVMEHAMIDVCFNTEVTQFSGSGGKLNAVDIRNNQTGETSKIDPAGVFVFIGQVPNTGYLDNTPIQRNRWGFIVTGHDLVHDRMGLPGFKGRDPVFLETNLPGIFAAGDARSGSTKQVASAAGEGATAALLVREYLKTV